MPRVAVKRMRTAKRLRGLALVVIAAGVAAAQQSPVPHAQLSQPAVQAGPHSGALGGELADGVATGRTIVRYDPPPKKHPGAWEAWSRYDEQGRLIIHVDRQHAGNQLWSIYLMLHEQARHYPQSDPELPPPPPPPADPGPALAASACQEADAECEAAYGLWQLFQSVGDLPVPCDFIQHVRFRWWTLWELCHGEFFLGDYCPELSLLINLC